MSESDRSRRLGDASNLQGALNSLGKVGEAHRIGFVHDRLMSAIDDICKTHQSNGTPKFTAAQMLILKDIAFAMIYILDPKNQGNRSFLKRLIADFKEQSPLKQIGLLFGALATLAAAAGGLYGAYQKASPWLEAVFSGRSDKIQLRAADPVKQASPIAPGQTEIPKSKKD
jgi:hypothetical protein